MRKKDSIQNEVKRLTEERNLYVKLLEEANLLFEEKVKELSLLKRIGDIIINTFDLESFCRNLVNIIIEETNAENCSLLLKDKDSENLVLKVASGTLDKRISFFEDIKKSNIIFAVGEGVAGKVALEGKPILIDDVNNDDRFDHSRKSYFPIGSLLCCPLVLQKHVLGVINLSNPHTHAFSHSDVRAITIFSAFVSSILSNAISYHELRKSEKELGKKARQLTIANKELERTYYELKSTQEQLIKVEKLNALGEMAAGIAHDFNNILAAILGRVQLLRTHIKPPLGKKEKRKSVLNLKAGLEVIEKAALDGAETVRRIQEFSRRRVDDKDFTQVDINELINNALEFTRVRWKNDAESKGIRINIQKKLSPLPFITGSSSELREVFTNLINNALDAMPQGGKMRINTFIDNNLAVIKFEDTGCGISKDKRERIFDPFFTTKGVHSTGLGLSVSYGIINRHRGTITVDSIEGQGSSFTIHLPLSKKAARHEGKEEKVTLKSRKQKKARILVIEDEEDVRQLLSDILTDGGLEVEIAPNGSQGIKIFKKKEFDLVFTDLGMPGMSGWQVADGIKKINRNIPVALITGWGVQLKDSELRKSGVDFIVNKPFQVDQVLRLVHEGIILRNRFKAV